MSIPQAIRGAQEEFAGLRPAERAQRLFVYARVFAAELFGTLLAVPFGWRALTLHRSLPDARALGAARSGTVSMLRDVRYGPGARNVLDIYLPPSLEATPTAQLGNSAAAPVAAAASGATSAAHPAGAAGASLAPAAAGTSGRPASDTTTAGEGGDPVVLFCHGGVWAAGSKWHYTPMAVRLAQAGVITAVMQYTLYPEALVPQMVAEVSAALSWTLDNARQLGGCPQQVSLVGHSAGAQLCAMALLHRALGPRTDAGAPAAAPAAASTPGDGRGPQGAAGMQTAPEGTSAGAAAAAGSGSAFADRRMPRRLVGMAGVYALAKHYEYEQGRDVHELSTMKRAVGGAHRFGSQSPAVVLARALGQQPQQPRDMLASWELVGGSSSSGATGEAGRQLLQQPEADAMHSSTAGLAGAGGRGSLPLPGSRGAAAPGDAAAAPGAAWRSFYQSIQLRGEGIARRVGLHRMAARPTAATVGATFVQRPTLAAAAAPEAAAVPEAATATAAAAAEGSAPSIGQAVTAAPAAGSAASASSGTAAFDPEDQIFELGVEDARRLPPTVLMSSSADMVVPWHESAEMHWALTDCGVPCRSLLYNKVQHADFVTGWRALPRVGGGAVHAGSDLADFAADLTAVVTGEVEGV